MPSKLSSTEWTEILLDKKLTNDRIIRILLELYSSKDHKASSGELGLRLGRKGRNLSGSVNLEIVRYAKRIGQVYDVSFSKDESGQVRYWDFFFKGWYEGKLFKWQLKGEIKEALEEAGLAPRSSSMVQPRPAQNTFLFIWNSKSDGFEDLQERLDDSRSRGYSSKSWRCNTKIIKPGDRAFLIKIGSEPKGIFGSGVAVSRVRGRKQFVVDIEFDTLLDPSKQLLPLRDLQRGKLNEQHWTPQKSGISIRPHLVQELEGLWSEFCSRQGIPEHYGTGEEPSNEIYVEGIPREITVTTYERDLKARMACLKHHGCSCSVCGFNFEDSFGKIGRGHIHVHHLKPLSAIRKKYKINPIKDLRPVCPNCHGMLHTKNPPLSIETLKSMIKSRCNALD